MDYEYIAIRIAHAFGWRFCDVMSLTLPQFIVAYQYLDKLSCCESLTVMRGVGAAFVEQSAEKLIELSAHYKDENGSGEQYTEAALAVSKQRAEEIIQRRKAHSVRKPS